MAGIVRRMSDVGATIEVESALGIPEHFHLLLPGEGPPQPCKRAWQSDRQVGLVFEVAEAAKEEAVRSGAEEAKRGEQIVRGQLLALRAALDVIASACCCWMRHEIAIHQPRIPSHVGLARTPSPIEIRHSSR